MGVLRQDLETPSRWPVLDGVRGLAVVCVVLYHAIRLLIIGEGAGAAESFTPLWWPVMTGRLALDAFFVLSGFLIVESWLAARRRAPRWRDAVGTYARKRAARILPGYYVSLAVLVPLVGSHLFRSPSDLALLAGVQQYLRPGLPSEVNVVYWSLTTEVHFYAIAPLVAVALRRFRPALVIGVSLATAICWQATTPGDLPQSLMIGRVDQFVLGAALAPVVRRWADRDDPNDPTSPLIAFVRPTWAGRALWVALLGCGMWQGAILAGHLTDVAALLHPVTGLVMAGLVLRLLTVERRSFLDTPWLRLAGIVSYGVYLFHYPILEYGYRWADLSAGTPGPFSTSAMVTVGLVAASFVAGGASYVMVERPFIRKSLRPAVLDLSRREREEAGLRAGSLQQIW